jgi:hypothetical protein
MNIYQPYGKNQPEVPHTHFLSEVALVACGFEQATRSSVPR